MQRIGVMTSGGDAPGMNAAIRAVVRKAVFHGIEVMGIRRGFNGFIEGDMALLHSGSVGGIIQRGGTVLFSARSPEFTTPAGRKKAWENVIRFGLQGLVAIGGDGTFHGVRAFHREYGLPVACIPATIDNDIAGTDYAVGFDTAVNNVVDAVDKIKDTATSHERTFVIEVMGRASGHIALAAGLAGGAESILVPERPVNIEDVCARLIRGHRRGKEHSIIIVAEGAGSALDIGLAIKERTGFDTKVTILGHLQRGGTPSVFDRNLASRMGFRAVEMLMDGDTPAMVGWLKGEIVSQDLDSVLVQPRPADGGLYRLADILSM
ncbi:MAG: 6-phosphofructokinase [Peptococcaceae bacterium]|nr:6-phosphofructokinase [Peptococcaceae bacterium]